MCGLPSGGLAVASAEAFAALGREDDARGFLAPRAACSRCRHAVGGTHASWGHDPVAVLELDFASPRWEPWRGILRPELRALAALAARHRAEFRDLLERERVIEALTGST